MPQDACLFPHLDVRDNVRFGMKSRNGSSRLFDEAVDILEIAPLLDRFPSTLSGGEKQRVALARAIATEPRLLLLDEPLAAVDFALRGRILPYLLRVRESMGIPFLYVTHNAGEARAVAEAALVLRRGAVAFAGTPDGALEVMSADEDPEARFDNILAGVREASGTGGEIGVLRVGEARFAVPSEKDVAAGTRAVYSVAPEDVLVSTRPLEGISARNVHAGRVVSVGTAGADAWIGISAAGLEWTARLTRTASDVLGLATGLDVWIAVKTQAFQPAALSEAVPRFRPARPSQAKPARAPSVSSTSRGGFNPNARQPLLVRGSRDDRRRRRGRPLRGPARAARRREAGACATPEFTPVRLLDRRVGRHDARREGLPATTGSSRSSAAARCARTGRARAARTERA